MIEEVINSILDAEKKAEEIIALQENESKALELKTETDAQSIKEKAIADFKQHRKSEIANAKTVAEGKYQKILSEGKAESEALYNKAIAKKEAESDKIVGRFLN